MNQGHSTSTLTHEEQLIRFYPGIPIEGSTGTKFLYRIPVFIQETKFLR
jgi:hypothetical protein